jgi:hypothetical protein
LGFIRDLLGFIEDFRDLLNRKFGLRKKLRVASNFMATVLFDSFFGQFLVIFGPFGAFFNLDKFEALNKAFLDLAWLFRRAYVFGQSPLNTLLVWPASTSYWRTNRPDGQRISKLLGPFGVYFWVILTLHAVLECPHHIP